MNINRSDGWVKLHKKTLYSVLFEDDAGYRLFSALLMMAHHKPNFASVRLFGEQVYLEPGELSASRSELDKLVGWKKDKSKDVLARLIKHGYITTRSDKHTTIITICNWSKYQTVENDQKEPQENPNRTTNKTPRKTPTNNRYDSQEEPQPNIQQNPKANNDMTPTIPQPPSVQKKEEEKNKEEQLYSSDVAAADSGDTVNEESVEDQIDRIIRYQPEELQAPLRQFIDYRKTTKSPIDTSHKLTLAVNKLRKMHRDDTATQIRSLERSIKNKWIGVFEVPDNPRVLAMFKVWHEITGLELDPDEKSAGNINACNRLLNKHGEDNLRKLIQLVAVAQNEQYAPMIGDFSTLDTKYNSLMAWAKKYYKTNTKPRVLEL